MKQSLRVNYKSVICGSIVALLMTGASVADDGPADSLSTGDIFKRAQETYNSLTSYSDTGKIITSYKGMSDDRTITTFTIKMARQNLFRIEWESQLVSRQVVTKSGKKAIWSAGNGTFWDVGNGPEQQKSWDMALLTQGGSSGDATLTIPGLFFKPHWGNVLGDLGLGEKKEASEKVGNIDCYVVSKKSNDLKTTLWIGKADFLIHQMRDVSIVKALESNDVPLPQSEPTMTTIETHSDIVVDQKFLPADFTR
jgi:outer membrane lipoprotein-sorting protein